MNDSLNFSLSNNNSYTLDKNEFTKDNYDFIGWNTKADGSGYSFSDKETININKVSYFTNNVLTLYAQWEESFKYKINTYSYDLNNHIIKEILPLTTVNEFKSKIELGSNCTIKFDSKTVNNKEVLYTGGKTKIYKNNQLLIEFTNVVTGDSNEDGKISSADLLSVRQHLLKIKVLKEAKLLAADSNKDGKISSADLLSIRQHLLGIKIIK